MHACEFTGFWFCVCVCTEHKQRAKAGEEPGELGKLRRKLLNFLTWSKHYEAAEHVSTFPRDGEGHREGHGVERENWGRG